MLRATTIFLVLAALVLGFGTLARSVLHLDCLGPVLPAWGCLAAPYPTTLPDGFGPFYYVAIAVAGWLACYTIRNPVYFAAGFVFKRLFPGVMEEATKPEPKAWRYR
ncbi:MAG TPA: hypothetical protein VF134_03215 [Candidatus Dormibacteraeota bacterium]